LIILLSQLADDLVLSDNQETGERTAGEARLLFTMLFAAEKGRFTTALLENSALEQVLRKDPSGVYPRMDRPSRRALRQEIERQASIQKRSAADLAKEYLSLAQKESEEPRNYMGYYAARQTAQKNRLRQKLFFALECILPVGTALALAVWLESIWLFFAVLLPLWEVFRPLLQFYFVRTTPPHHIPGLDLFAGVPEEGRVLTVIATLLTDEKQATKMSALLEEYYLANQNAGSNAYYGLLADFPDAKTQHKDTDNATLAAVKSEIDRLNEQYGKRFCLIHRNRTYHAPDKVYMGRERKRGALTALAALIAGGESESLVHGLSVSLLQSVKYCITLDSDTRLLPMTVTKMVGTMLHPLNRPVWENGRVQSGFGILQPRMTTELESVHATEFARVFAGQGGLSSYEVSVGEFYQDLFGRGIFMGKGILDIRLMHEALKDKMPDNQILSHDLLEGCFLSAGFLSRVELSDGFPARAGSYFLRMGRWIRGDWQLLPWLCSQIPTKNKKKIKNPLPFLCRYQMADNLRRSITPPVLWASIAAFCIFSQKAQGTPHGRGLTALFLSTLLALFLPMIHMGLSLLLAKGRRVGTRCRATIYAGIGGAMIGSFSRFLLLPHEAWVCIRSIGRSLWRMAVSKKKLLEWVTAAEAEKMSSPSVLGAFIALSACPVSAALVAVAGMNAASFTVAILWFLGPVYAWFLSQPLPKGTLLPDEDKSYLLERAKEISQYFQTYMTKEDHFLPPDNIQLAPCREVARRTSPTNIGFGLLAPIAAAELGLPGHDDAIPLLEKQLDTIEKMEKHRGHLYNWYATDTLAVLPPMSLSSVDSGNLAAALVAVESWLLRKGQEKLARRAGDLWRNMDFSIFYDREKNLLHVGRDHTTGMLTESVYDMLASEARLTSYIAIAKGDVPPSHWWALGRPLSKTKGIAGLYSWGGSMFEYLMPQIFLPNVKNSLIDQSNRYAVFCQRLRTKGGVWGCSESGFFAFDGGLHYRYKGHGVAALGLAPGLDEELVIAPYASYLALLVEPEAALKNIKALFAQGFAGNMGLYEAIDFTSSRLAGEKRAVVQSYMAHHMGMSLCALANVLTENEQGLGLFRQLFLQNPAMAAYESLLGERIPLWAPVIRPSKKRSLPPVSEKPLHMQFENPSQVASGLHLLSGDAGRIIAFANGKTEFSLGKRSIYRSTPLIEGGPFGVVAAVKVRDGAFSLGGWDFYENLPLSAEFSETKAYWKREAMGIRLEKSLSYFPGLNTDSCTEKTVYTVKNMGENPVEVSFCVYFEPVMIPRADFESHPAFARLMLESSPLENGVLVKQKDREGHPPTFAAFTTDQKASFTAARSEIFGRFGKTDVQALFENPESHVFGALPDGAVRMLCRFSLAPGEAKRIQTALSAGSSREQVLAESVAALKGEYRPSNRLKLTASALSLDGVGVAEALTLGGKLLSQYSKRFFSPSSAGPRDTLWRLGISGDLPIALLDGRSLAHQRTREIYKAIRFHRLLAENGLSYDLVILTNDGSDYGRPQHTDALRALALIGSEHRLGQAGGVHLMDATVLSEEEKTTLKFSASLLLPDDTPLPSAAPMIPYAPRSAKNVLTGNAKSQPLANRYFGVLSADFGLTHLWCSNSRLFRLTPWENDPLLAKSFGEELCLYKNGRRTSLFCADDGYFARCDFGPGNTVWYKEIDGLTFRTTAFVDPKRALRTVIIEAEGDLEHCAIDWMLRPVLGEQNTENNRVITTFDAESNTMLAKNPFSPRGFPKIMAITADVPLEEYTGDFFAYAQGDFNGKTGAGLYPCMAARLPLQSPTGRVRMVLSVMAGENAHSLPTPVEDPDRALLEAKSNRLALCSHVKIQTPSVALNHYINRWNAWQIKGSRLYARSSIYQNGGAYGFRDQLQDATAFLLTEPRILKEQLLRSACHQYKEGDVQHWWHGGTRGGLKTHKGVRTRCSDDLLWMCLCAYWYVSATNDESILDIPLPYLVSRPLEDHEVERYEEPSVSSERETFFEHCVRAAELFMRRGTGEHGIPFILGGDWNDGMNRLGGESAFMARFGSLALSGLAQLARRKGKEDLAARFENFATSISEAANKAFDDGWFLRGYDKHGRPVGSSHSKECQIDSLAQSFAVFDPKNDLEKTSVAIESAITRLVSHDHKLIKLFTPPFQTDGDPGYIAAYPPGVRENGGQYTHAAVWLSMATLLSGRIEEGTAMLLMLLPAHHDPKIYRAEDFVLAADVAGEGQLTGRAGWSWYTGAAGWYRRAVLEVLLGITVQNGFLTIAPRVPKSWPGFSCVIQYGNSEYRIMAKRGLHEPPSKTVSYDDDGKIHEIWIGL
jgi:cyclic beta-1,2-glucan synthetase